MRKPEEDGTTELMQERHEAIERLDAIERILKDRGIRFVSRADMMDHLKSLSEILELSKLW